MFLSAFFSGSETALFSLQKSDLHRFSSSSHKIERSLARLMTKPQDILITILIGNLFVNFIISALATHLLLIKWPDYGHFLSIVFATPLVIILAEIFPKILAVNFYRSVSKKVFFPLSFFHALLLPLRVFLLFHTEGFIKIFRLKLQDDKITKDELAQAVDLGEEEGIIDKEEGNFIDNVIYFSQKEASNVMLPRSRAVFIKEDASILEAIDIFNKSDLIRAPVYKGSYDNIVGMIDSKELLSSYLGFKRNKKIKKFIRPINFFPASKELSELLDDFLTKKIEIAIVMDEYGGTAGVVHLKSILVELLGKNFSKWELNSDPIIKEKDSQVVVVSGDMQLNDFNRNFKADLESLETETISGYIIEKLNYFPEKGEEISLDNHLLKIKKVSPNSILEIEVFSRS